jgi:C-terminal processing protease CtpA/Prc
MIRRFMVVCSIWVLLSLKGWSSGLAPGHFSFHWENNQGWLYANEAPASAILKRISEVTGIPIVLVPNDHSRVTLSLAGRDLEKLVNSICAGSAITYLQDPVTGQYRIEKIRMTSSVDSAVKNEQLRELITAQAQQNHSSPATPPVRYTGIGARVALNEDKQGLWLSPLAPNAPAAKAGIAEGDLVLAIDGKSVAEFGGLPDIVAAIQGPMNTQVQLRLRKSNGTEVVKSVTREVVDYASAGP